MKGNNTYANFFCQFSMKAGKRSWRYVALFFCTLKHGKKTSKMKGNNTYAHFV